MSTCHGFFAGVLSKANKRKISTRGEDLLLQLLAKAEDLTTAEGKVITKVGEEPATMSRGAKEGNATRYNELQPTVSDFRKCTGRTSNIVD